MKILLVNPPHPAIGSRLPRETRLKNAGLGLFAFGVAMALWLPCLHSFFSKPVADFYQEKGISHKSRQLAARHLQLWTEPTLRQAELKKMRTSNAEWDSMLFGVSELLGLREYTTFLSGTSANLNVSWQTAATVGLVHLLLYVAFIVLVPVSLITAGLLLAWNRWIGRQRIPNKEPAAATVALMSPKA